MDDASTDATPDVAERGGARADPPARAARARTRRATRASRPRAATLSRSWTTTSRRPPGWLRALLRRAPRATRDADVVRRADPRALRGARAAQLRARGAADHDARPRRRRTARPSAVWSANMALRRATWRAVGPFPEDAPHRRRRGGVAASRCGAPGGTIVYLADALARAPPRGRRRAAAARSCAAAYAPRPQPARLGRAPGRGARARPRAARAGGLRVARGAAALPAGADHGRPLARAGPSRRCGRDDRSRRRTSSSGESGTSPGIRAATRHRCATSRSTPGSRSAPRAARRAPRRAAAPRARHVDLRRATRDRMRRARGGAAPHAARRRARARRARPARPRRCGT